MILKAFTKRQKINWTELKCQFSCVARTVQSERPGSLVHFIPVHFVRSVSAFNDETTHVAVVRNIWDTVYVSDSAISGCARYPRGHSCREMFWTAGQRYDLDYKPSPFVWKQTPGTGSCCGGTCMSEMRYTYWSRGEPNNWASYDANLDPVSPPLPEKCLQLCRGWNYKWNDALCEIPTCSICEVDISNVARHHWTYSGNYYL